MYNIQEKFLRDLLRDYSRVIVRRVCSQSEILEQDDTLSKSQSLILLKQFSRELIYNSFKDLEAQIKSYKEGRSFSKFNINTTPCSKNE